MVGHSRLKIILWLIIVLSGSFSAPLLSDTFVDQEISKFSTSGLVDWDEKSFNGNTSYRIVELDGEKVLQAISLSSASALYKKYKINLKETPYLNWRWRISNKISSGDETKKKGDDYAVRIYLIIDGGLQFWKTRALNYVWANNAARGSIWNNAYAGKSVKMYALRSEGDRTNKWLTEKRNVYDDIKGVFGDEVINISAVAIMTDTDDSGGRAESYYSNIFFSAD